METKPRVLVAIPAYNEAESIGTVIERVRESLSDFDLLVVNDGSRDATGRILNQLGVLTTTHLCNLGYGRAIQTALTYALRRDYDVLITLDADGQHYPEQVKALYQENLGAGWDVLIGSRYVGSHVIVDPVNVPSKLIEECHRLRADEPATARHDGSFHDRGPPSGRRRFVRSDRAIGSRRDGPSAIWLSS